MSDTPRTDAMVSEFEFPWPRSMEFIVRHAEHLERELAIANTLLGQARADQVKNGQYVPGTTWRKEDVEELVARAHFTLLEQRIEFVRGELGDLDKLEDALKPFGISNSEDKK